MSKLLVANWKMNPQTVTEAKKLVKTSDVRGVVICPPFVYLPVLSGLRKAKLGAQDVFWEEKGAYTGEVSAAMLKNLGVKYVIIGHSERRKWLHETDDLINKKVLAAFKAGLKVILCVGEQIQVRKLGLAAAKKFILKQLKKDLQGVRNLKIENLKLKIIVAYEPIWAIGTGRPDKPEQTAEMARFIKHVLRIMYYVSGMRVLYGGSVNSGNAKMFLDKKEIDGALVGGASIKPKEFGKIIKIAQRLS